MPVRLLCILLLLPALAFAQQIKQDEIDGFTGQRTIETTIVSLKTAYTSGLGISLAVVGQHFVVNIVGYGNGIGAIRKEDVIHLLLNDGLVITATSIGDQPGNEGGLTKVFQHHYLLKRKDLDHLLAAKVVLLRISTVSGNLDVPVTKRGAKEINKMTDLLLKTLSKAPPAK